MKKLRRKFNVVVIVCLIALLTLPIQSFAAGGTAITFGQIKGKTGDVVEVPVKVNDLNSDLLAYGLELNFDQKALEITGVKDTFGSNAETKCSESKEGCIWYNYLNAEGFIRVAWADPSAGDHPLNGNQTLFTIQFLIKNEGLLSENSLSINANDKEAFSFVGTTNNPIPIKVEVGSINVPTKDPSGGTKGSDEGDKNSGSDQGDKSTGTNTSEGTDQSPSNASSSTDPVSGDKGSKDSSKETNNPNLEKLPKTGDDSYIDTYLNIGIGVLIIALVSMWFLAKRSKLKEN